MAARNVSSLLKYGVAAVIIVILLGIFFGKHGSNSNHISLKKNTGTANNDSAVESLDTLTAELASTKKQVTQITQENVAIKNQNETLIEKLQGSEDSATTSLSQEIDQLKQ